MNSARPYSMAIRGEKAAATRQRILDAARSLFDDATEITLERVAAVAGTSVQTVLRAYGSKEELVVAAIGSFRVEEPVPSPPIRSIGEAVRRLFDDYEAIGDRVIRILAAEHQIAAFAEIARSGRERHRTWVKAAFAAGLAKVPSRRREPVLVALLAATDVYLWKLLRRDFGLDRAASEAAVERLVRGALETSGAK
jgi:AcrR family transcriptional regulator